MKKEKNILFRRLLTPILVFVVAVEAALVLQVGYEAYNREQRAIEDYAGSRMKSLTLDLDIKTKSTQAVMLAGSHAGHFNLDDSAAVFRELAATVADGNFISNVCLEIWDEDNDLPDAVHTLYYVGRDSVGRIDARCLHLTDEQSAEADMAGYLEAERTGSIAWSQPYYDSLFCNAQVLTCYKKCEDPGMVLSADLKLSTLLENIDSLQIYKGSIMCVQTRAGEAYTLDDGRIWCVTGEDYGPDKNILMSVDYPTLGLEILSVVPKKEVYTYMWGSVMMVFVVFSLVLLALAVLAHRSLRKAEKNLTESVRKEAEEEMALKKIEADLAMAAHLQTRMLTSPGRGVHLACEGCRPVDIMSVLIPAREVGGDFYDYRLVGHHLLMGVGDVSGKGIPASVVMTMCGTLFHAYRCDADPDPADVLGYINAQLCRRNEQMMFATMWVGALDLRSGRLKYASAAHNCPVLTGDGASLLKTAPGTPLGLFDEAVYKDSECLLAPGSSLLLYTDGITEAENGEFALFGEDALLRVCASVVSRTPQVICHSVLTAVREHAAGALQSDDITLMCVTFDGRLAQMNGLDDALSLHTLAEECSGGCRTALALEELAVNAFDYGGAGFVSASFEDGIYTLVDDGALFDPTSNAAEPSPDDDGLSIGGRGIDLVRKVTSLFTWRREGRYNVTRLKIEEMQ